MADNSTLDPGSGGDTYRSKDRAGVKTSIVALDLSPASGSETLMNGAMPVTDNGGTLSVDDGGSSITVDGTVSTTTQAADGAALPSAVMAIGGFDGTNTQAIVTDSTGRLVPAPTTQAGATVKTTDYDTGAGTDTVPMQGLALPASGGAVAGGTSTNPVRTDPTGSTTQPVSGTVTANAGSGTFGVAGSVAHDAADSGAPVKTGARARTSDVTAVAADDRADSICTVLGKPVVMPYTLPGNLTKGTANSTGTSDTSVISAPGAGVTLYITSITVTNAHATVGTKVQIKSGTTATGYPRVFAAANGGGASMTFPSPLKLAANEALQFACVTTGADVDVSASGYTAAE